MITPELALPLETLQRGGLVGIPTETVYGLAARAFSEDAVRSVFTLKGRPFFDPLIVHGADIGQFSGVIKGFSATEQQLAELFWPGPLTIVTEKSKALSSLITSGHPSVAVRIPKHPLTLELLRQLGEPVVAPSANLFGRTSPTSALHVQGDFPELLILDGGETEIGIESTVVQVEGDEIRILRPGGVSREMLEEKLPGKKIIRVQSSVSPGSLKHHYQPKTPLIVYRGAVPKDIEGYRLALPSDPVLAARTLYAALREGDRQGSSQILLAWEFPETGPWEAIWDRLRRAATEIRSAG